MAKIEKPESKDQGLDKSSKRSNKSSYSKKKKIKKNEDLTGLVNKKVQEYISIHSLYSN